MSRRGIGSGSPYEQRAGYARALAAGPWVFVSGTTGLDPASMTISDDVCEQARRAFATIAAALAEAGADLDDAVRVRYVLTDAADFDRLAPVFAEHLGRARAAATAIVAGLVDPRMRIEIELTALRRDADGGR